MTLPARSICAYCGKERHQYYEKMIDALERADHYRDELIQTNAEVVRLRLAQRMLDAKMDELRAENDRLREALDHAIELAEEGWAYADDYFRAKWGCEERIKTLREALGGEQ